MCVCVCVCGWEGRGTGLAGLAESPGEVGDCPDFTSSSSTTLRHHSRKLITERNSPKIARLKYLLKIQKFILGGFPGGLVVKKKKKKSACQCTETQETQVQSLGQEDPLEEEMATQSSILAWKIPWTEEPGDLQSIMLRRVGHN